MTNGIAPAPATIDAEQMASAPLPVRTQQQLLAQQLVEWKCAAYNISVSLRVARAIGDPPEQVEKWRAEAERCQKAIDQLAGLIAELSQTSEQPHG